MSRRAVVLIGSPRARGQSASDTLARHVSDRLEYLSFEVAWFRARELRREARMIELLGAIAAAETLILATPLYVDSLPYLVTRAIERIRDERPDTVARRGCGMLAIVQCGFPEVRHTYVALDICRLFAAQAGFTWIGGLGMGGGEAVKGKRLKDLGGMARNVVRALDLAADAIVNRKELPAEAVQLMAKPMVPARVYTMFGNFGWYRQAIRNGTLKHLRDRPYSGKR